MAKNKTNRTALPTAYGDAGSKEVKAINKGLVNGRVFHWDGNDQIDKALGGLEVFGEIHNRRIEQEALAAARVQFAKEVEAERARLAKEAAARKAREAEEAAKAKQKAEARARIEAERLSLAVHKAKEAQEAADARHKAAVYERELAKLRAEAGLGQFKAPAPTPAPVVVERPVTRKIVNNDDFETLMNLGGVKRIS